jgi:hypothetical protein
MRRIGGIPWLTLAVLLTVRSGPALADSEPMAGRVAVVKRGKLVRLVGRPPVAGGEFTLPTADPTVEGGRLAVVDVDDPAVNEVVYDLPVQPAPFGWTALGVPPGARGYRYRGAGSAGDPCRTVLIKRKIVKAVCRGAGVTLATPAVGTLAMALSVGMASDHYCAAFGGEEVRNDDVLKRRDAPPPACACGAVPPTELRFAAGPPGGQCGQLTAINGSMALDCGILYFGGGQVGTPPFTVADMVDPTTLGVACCNGETLVLGPAHESAAGPKRCTRKGCLFGPPLVVPNTGSTPQSVCVYPVYQDDARGVARCDTGEMRLTLPIVGEAYLTGDILPKRCSGGTSPGLRCGGFFDPPCPGGGTCVDDNTLQPCPICNPQTGVCNGGMDNGMACVPGSVATPGATFPTSRDCRVSTLVKVADIPLPLSLSTGTVTRVAFDSANQPRVFCGFCRDADETLGFALGDGAGVPCSSDAECAQPFESCEQRSGGAFFKPAHTLTEIGAPGGALDDYGPHAATLVSVFCLPPTFVALIDSPSDLPGPGAAAFKGVVQLGSPGGAFVDG